MVKGKKMRKEIFFQTTSWTKNPLKRNSAFFRGSGAHAGKSVKPEGECVDFLERFEASVQEQPRGVGQNAPGLGVAAPATGRFVGAMTKEGVFVSREELDAAALLFKAGNTTDSP